MGDAVLTSKNTEQTSESHPSSSCLCQSCVSEQSADVVDLLGMKPHWRGEIGWFSYKCLSMREWIWRSSSLLTIGRIEIGW